MKTVISAKDIEDLLSKNGSLSSLPSDAIFTPSARDLLRDLERKNGIVAASSKNVESTKNQISAPAKQLNSKSPKAELEALFNSPYCQNLKEQLCEIGRRLWQRAYVDGNGGN